MPINEISWNADAEGSIDLAGNPALADFKYINGLAKAFVDTKALVGNSIRIPSSEAGTEDMQTFYTTMQEKVPGLMVKPDLTDDAAMAAVMTSLGTPEAAEGYAIPEVKGMEITDERKKFLKDTAFSSGLTAKQFEKWVKDIHTADSQAITARKESTQQEIAGLRNEWGTAFENKYAKTIKIAEATGAPPEVIKALKEQTAGVATIKWFDGLAGALGSEDFQLATLPAGEGGITPSEARERASEIRNKLNTIDQSNPEYQNLLKKMMDFDKLGKQGQA